jgi:hypothetical protein
VDSYSDVVGYQKMTLPGNAYKGVGISLVNPSILNGSIASQSSSVVTISGASSIGSLLNDTQSYYVEVTSNVNGLVGNRFDVDVAATRSANNANLALNAGSVRNTRNDLSSLSLAGDSVVLRQHVTFDQIRASIVDQSGLVGNDDSAEKADVLYLYRGAGFVAYWLGGDKVSWFTGDDPDDHRYDVIAPGQGVLFRKKGTTPASLVSTGAVRNNDYISVLAQGYQLSSPGFPVSYTPVQLGGTVASQNNPGGWSVNSQILTYSGAGFAANTLMADGTWDNGVDPDPVNDVVLVNGDTAFMTKLGSKFVGKETKPY